MLHVTRRSYKVHNPEDHSGKLKGHQLEVTLPLTVTY